MKPHPPDLTPEQHVERHAELNDALDELLTDFIVHNPPGPKGYFARSIGELVAWSKSQVENQEIAKNARDTQG